VKLQNHFELNSYSKKNHLAVDINKTPQYEVIIAVLLPFFNAGQFLGRAIESVLRQDFEGFELLLLNDGSTDNSLRIAAQYSDNRIRLIDLPHKGLVSTLNTGLKMARGMWIARMDADDEMWPNRLSRQLAFAKQNPNCSVVGCKVEYEGAEAGKGYDLHVQWQNELLTHQEVCNNRFIDAPLAHPSVMFKKELVHTYGPYLDFDGPEDYELWLRWMDRGVCFGKVPETLLTWYDRPDRLSRRHDKYSAEAFFRLKARYFEKWAAKNLPEDRPILIWGNGKTVRKKSRPLWRYDLPITGYIDVRPQVVQMKKKPYVYHFEDIPEGAFILSYVGDRNGKQQIEEFFRRTGRLAGTDYFFMC
jgi:glycosyltransferase involved in cell wall biosynthesis